MQSDTTPRKMLRIIDLIEESDGPVTAERMLAELGFTRSTLYRHLKILSETGFVASISDSGFTLGPRIVELDYKIRSRDPLLAASRPLMVELAQTERGVALLCRRYQDRVLCIHQERGDVAFRSNYTRGLARPLFRGAASRIILANLKGATIDRLQAKDADGFDTAGLGATGPEVRASLRRLRKQGWDVTEGQVTPGVVGVAAPLFDARGDVLGSLSLTLPARERSEAEMRRLIDRVCFCAGIIRNTIDHLSSI
jgi:DNA-binding IclR family transcriptional regulator